MLAERGFTDIIKVVGSCQGCFFILHPLHPSSAEPEM